MADAKIIQKAKANSPASGQNRTTKSQKSKFKSQNYKLKFKSKTKKLLTFLRQLADSS